MRLDIDQAAGSSAIRISFTDQRLTGHGGMIAWSHFLHQKNFRRELAAAAIETGSPALSKYHIRKS